MFLSSQVSTLQCLCFCEFYTGRFQPFLHVKAAEPTRCSSRSRMHRGAELSNEVPHHTPPKIWRIGVSSG